MVSKYHICCSIAHDPSASVIAGADDDDVAAGDDE
jgi:hypothetical protein